MKKQAPLLGLGIIALSLLLFYVFYEYVFYVNLFNENVVGLAIWSAFIGLVFFLYAFTSRKISLLIMSLFYVVAYGVLFSIFYQNEDPFANITGLLIFIFIIIGGFLVTLLYEGYMWYTKKYRS